MRHPQIVVFETDGALGQYLQPLAQERRWLLREPRQGPACLQLLREAGPTVLVLKIGRHLVRDLTFLDEAHGVAPDVPIVAVGDAEDSVLMGLTLELGASHVSQPPQPRRRLTVIVASLMEQAVRRLGAGERAPLQGPAHEPAG